jgi:hypothetical protein
MSKSSDWHPDFTGDFGARVWFPDLIKEGEWHHIVIVLNRQVVNVKKRRQGNQHNAIQYKDAQHNGRALTC